MSKKKKKRFARARRAVRRATRKVVSKFKGVSRMARKKKRGGKSRATRRFGRGGGSGGFASKEILAVVGGAVASGIATPFVAKYLPASLRNSPVTLAASSIAIGALGFMLLRRWNRTAALGFAAATIAPAVLAFTGVGKKKGLSGLYGVGEPDGIDYLGVSGSDDDMQGLLAGDDDLSGDDDMQGMGSYDDAQLEV